MPDIGIITGRAIKINRDGDSQRLIMQVELITDEDVRSIELVTQAGEDTNPANGCRVCILDISDGFQVGVGVTDFLTPEVEPGEKEFYSTDNPVTSKLARIKLNKDSEIILNQGTDFAVRYSKLEEAFNQLKADFDAHTHPYVDTPIGPSTTSATAPSTADITGAKVEDILLP